MHSWAIEQRHTQLSEAAADDSDVWSVDDVKTLSVTCVEKHPPILHIYVAMNVCFDGWQMYIYSYLVDVMLANLHQLLDNLLERSASEAVPWQVSCVELLRRDGSWYKTRLLTRHGRDTIHR